MEMEMAWPGSNLSCHSGTSTWKFPVPSCQQIYVSGFYLYKWNIFGNRGGHRISGGVYLIDAAITCLEFVFALPNFHFNFPAVLFNLTWGAAADVLECLPWVGVFLVVRIYCQILALLYFHLFVYSCYLATYTITCMSS